MSTPVEDAIQAFMGYLRRNGAAPATPVKYGQHLATFAAWAGDRRLGEVTAAQIDQGYLARWWDAYVERKGKEPATATYKNHVQALRALYNYADRFDYIRDATGQLVRNPMVKIEMPRVRKQIKPWLTPDEYQALIDACLTPDERYLVMLLGESAMRISETATPWSDADLSTNPGSILIRQSKTEEGQRRIAITSELRSQLIAYRQRKQPKPDEPILATRFGNPVLEQQANRSLKRIAKRAGLTKNVSCHTLRRTWAMNAIARGVSIDAVSAHLGHANISTTQAHYGRIQYAQVEAEVLAALA